MTATEPPPITPTGDSDADDELRLLRATTASIHEAFDRIAGLSAERQRLVLSLRRRGILFSTIAEAVPTTEQTIYKIHRDGKREAAHAAGDHALCAPSNCPVLAERDAPEAEEA